MQHGNSHLHANFHSWIVEEWCCLGDAVILAISRMLNSEFCLLISHSLLQNHLQKTNHTLQGLILTVICLILPEVVQLLITKTNFISFKLIKICNHNQMTNIHLLLISVKKPHLNLADEWFYIQIIGFSCQHLLYIFECVLCSWAQASMRADKLTTIILLLTS